MSSDNPSIISHVSIGTNQFDQARAFYDKVLATLGIVIIMEHPGAVAFGRQYPEFWLGVPHDGKPASVGNGFHMGFIAANKEQVHAFHEAALAAGATATVPRARVRCTVNRIMVVSCAISTATRSRPLIGMPS